MPKQLQSEHKGTLVKVLLIANLCFWLYFWLAFSSASQPYDPRPLGHVPVDPYVFWGHAIGLIRSSMTYPFVRVTFWIEFPSFFVVTLFANVFLASVSGDQIVTGISIGGYELLAIMLLSFLQWYLIGWAIEKLWHRWSNRQTAAPNQRSSTTSTG
jgi:hypothetical protein